MKITQIERYSFTNEPDEQGRWARLMIYNGLCVAWISLHREKYLAKLNFPTKGGDVPHEALLFNTFDEAVDFVEEKFRWFREKLA